jgi:hypothetical protein
MGHAQCGHSIASKKTGEGGGNFALSWAGVLGCNPFLKYFEVITLSGIPGKGAVLVEVAVFLAIGGGLLGSTLGRFEMVSVPDESLDSVESLLLVEDDESLKVRGSARSSFSAHDSIFTMVGVKQVREE